MPKKQGHLSAKSIKTYAKRRASCDVRTGSLENGAEFHSSGGRPHTAESLIPDGCDSLNLVEFPLGGIADRHPPGRKTLVFENEVIDSGRGEMVKRRLVISGADKYGLPTALDDEVILGLIQLTLEQGFRSRRVPFSRYHLLRLLDWRDEGRSYRRLDTSLCRWLGVTLYFRNAWWDPGRQMWMSRGFHVLEQYDAPDEWSNKAKRLGCDGQDSAITWHQTVFTSFENDRLKKLDMEIYRKLKSAAAKRIYRFVDKRFWFSKTLTYELKQFAFEHIGLSRCYDNSQIRRLLQPALTELERLGFLAPLPPDERYRRVARGHWKIWLAKNGASEKGGAVPESRKETCPASRRPGRRRPAASKEVARSGHREAPERQAKSPKEDRRQLMIREYLAALTDDSLSEFEREAFDAAESQQIDGFRRNSELGRIVLADQWRRVIVEAHAARKLGV